MHPVSSALLVCGYLLALPIVGRLEMVMGEQRRLALAGHQVGIAIAAAGWALRSSITIAVAHVVWIVLVRVWFAYAGRRSG